MPITPTIAPCTTKMPMMLRGLAPSVRRMAMSARLSVTVITSVLTRLKAATATISVRMMNIMRFSSCTAANQVRFWRVQSRISKSPRQGASPAAAATSRAWCRSLQLQPHAGRALEPEDARGVVHVQQRQRRVVFEVAGVEGADHRHLLEARHHAGRRDLAAGRDQRDRVAFAHAQAARQLAAQHDAELARHQPAPARAAATPAPGR